MAATDDGATVMTVTDIAGTGVATRTTERIVMRLFVTGASGWIGSAVVGEALANGHTVLGLARSDSAAERIRAAGAEVLRGDVTDLDALRTGAADSEGVVHLAFRHDIAFSGDFATATQSDREAIEAIGDVLAGTDRPLAIASGIAGLKIGSVVTESDRASEGRAGNEQAALALADRGVRSMSVRFAPTVHGAGDNGFMALVLQAARTHGSSAYIGDGANRWPAVHRSDAARLVRLGIEHAPAGSVLHGVGEEGVQLRAVAETIGQGLDIPVESIPQEAAGARFGFLAGFLGLDTPASSAATQELLDWRPTGPTLLEDLASGVYFSSPAS